MVETAINVLLQNTRDRGEQMINANYVTRVEQSGGSGGGIVLCMADGKLVYAAGTVRGYMEAVEKARNNT